MSNVTFAATIAPSLSCSEKIIVNSSTSMFGRKIYANAVMLGALTETTRVVSRKAMEDAIRNSIPEEMLKENHRGFQLGLKLIAV